MAEQRRRRGPRPASERLRRLLVMLPWLMERGRVSVAEMAAHFHLSEDELVGDLELAAMCGLPPYLDEMVDLWVDEGEINVGVPRLFTRPLRLTAPEAFHLLAAAEAAAALPGADADGALARALAKVRAKLGSTVNVAVVAPPFTDAVERAVTTGAELDIRYWSAGRDETTRRRIVPRLVFEDRGDLYVLADDDRSGAERIFRIDRIEALEETGRTVPVRPAAAPGEWFTDGDVEVATLVLAPEGRWAAERYPVREVTERADGGLDVVLAVVSERWLGRLLLRLGPSATVVAPAKWTDLGARTAERVLARYRRAG